MIDRDRNYSQNLNIKFQYNKNFIILTSKPQRDLPVLPL